MTWIFLLVNLSIITTSFIPLVNWPSNFSLIKFVGNDIYWWYKSVGNFRFSCSVLDCVTNSRNISSIFFHCGESIEYWRRLWHFLSFVCHIRFFASSLLANNRSNLGIIGKYHNTLARRPSISSSALVWSTFSKP